MSSLFAGQMPEVSYEEVIQEIRNLGAKLNLPEDSKVLGPLGDGSSRVLFIGEAAGPNDAANGEPFSGPYSQIFNQELLPGVGLNRKNIYLTNVVKNSQQLGQPLPVKLITYWNPILPMEIAMVRPKLIVTMGRYAMEYFLPRAKLTEIRGRIFEVPLFTDFAAPVLTLIHPANAHRFPEQKDQIKADFMKIKQFLESDLVIPEPIPAEFANTDSGSEELF